MSYLDLLSYIILLHHSTAVSLADSIPVNLVGSHELLTKEKKKKQTHNHIFRSIEIELLTEHFQYLLFYFFNKKKLPQIVVGSLLKVFSIS